jgi:hypothetical protein
MKTHRWADIKHRGRKPSQIQALDERVEERLDAIDLRAIRELLGQTQRDVAEAAQMEQSEVSRLERRADWRMSTLRRYVEALGGELEIFANFEGKSVRLVKGTG